MNYKIKALAILIIFLWNAKIQGQNYAMFWNALSLFNPASSGLSQKLYTASIDRVQWLGMKNAPFTSNEIFDMKLEAIHGGTGINYIYDKFALTKNHNFNINYCYHLNLKEERILSLGISGGLTFEKIDYSSFMLPPEPDPYIPKEENSTLFNFKFGLAYKSNQLEVGLSSTHVKRPRAGNYNSSVNSNYWLFGSYNFHLGENIDLKPNLLIRTNDSKNSSLSSGLLIMYKERFWTGISCTIDNSIGFMVGFDIMGVTRIGYSFDISTSSINKYNKGNHEIVLAVMLK